MRWFLALGASVLAAVCFLGQAGAGTQSDEFRMKYSHFCSGYVTFGADTILLAPPQGVTPEQARQIFQRLGLEAGVLTVYGQELEKKLGADDGGATGEGYWALGRRVAGDYAPDPDVFLQVFAACRAAAAALLAKDSPAFSVSLDQVVGLLQAHPPSGGAPAQAPPGQ